MLLMPFPTQCVCVYEDLAVYVCVCFQKKDSSSRIQLELLSFIILVVACLAAADDVSAVRDVAAVVVIVVVVVAAVQKTGLDAALVIISKRYQSK